MLDLVILSIILASLFGLGYYLGNQFGRSAQIRAEIQRARDANVIVRIQNQ
jgi:hypothetical protein